MMHSVYLDGIGKIEVIRGDVAELNQTVEAMYGFTQHRQIVRVDRDTATVQLQGTWNDTFSR